MSLLVSAVVLPLPHSLWAKVTAGRGLPSCRVSFLCGHSLAPGHRATPGMNQSLRVMEAEDGGSRGGKMVAEGLSLP